MTKTIRTIGTGALLALWVIVTLCAWLLPNREMSLPERRKLAQMPELSTQTLLDGSFMDKFDTFTQDQFPLRDSFRSLKSVFSYNVLGQKDNNGIYIAGGYAAQLEYPLNQASLDHALSRFNAVYTRYLADSGSRIYMTVIPDKGYYLAQENGYPAMDYADLFRQVAVGMPWAKQITITDTLQAAAYYRTDTHWRQEKLLETANALCAGMELPQISNTFVPTLAMETFYGVYYGQSALPMAAEELYILKSDLLESCRVYNYETGTYHPVYDTTKLDDPDPYEVYLAGPQALLRMENPNAKTDRELIVFRDSFGSSLVPLLMEHYRTITLVDLRYIHPNLLGQFLTFQGQDVLFAYSTLILNNSETLK